MMMKYHRYDDDDGDVENDYDFDADEYDDEGPLVSKVEFQNDVNETFSSIFFHFFLKMFLKV